MIRRNNLEEVGKKIFVEKGKIEGMITDDCGTIQPGTKTKHDIKSERRTKRSALV